MKKTFTFLASLLLSATIANAQNLVTCGDFETSASESWTTAITQTGSAADTSKVEFVNNNKNAHGGNYYANGGSSWGKPSKSFTATLTNNTTVSLTSGTSYVLTFYYKIQGMTSLTCTLTSGETVLTETVDCSSNKTSWTEYTATITPTASGNYTLAFNIGDTHDGNKQDYFQIDDVTLQSSNAALTQAISELTKARDTYDSNSLVYQYLNAVITAKDETAVNRAKDIYSSLTNIKFSDDKNEYWYYVYIPENGVVVAGQGTSNNDQESLVTAYPTGDADSLLWKFEGSYSGGFKMKNKGNGHYARYNGSSKLFQTIRNNSSAATFYLAPVPSTVSRIGWNLKQSADATTAMNPNGGAYGGTTLALYKNTDPNDAIGFIASDGLETLTDNNNIENNVRKNVIVNRTINSGWATLCLPFEVQKGQLTAIFGNDVELYEMTAASGDELTFTRKNISQYNNSDNKSRDNNVVMNAGKPYLLKVSNTVSNPVFIQALENTATNNVTFNNVSFKGNYASSLSSEGLYGVTANGQVKQGKNGVSFSPWTAYFQTTTNTAKLNISVDGSNIITGIESIESSNLNPQSSKLYDITGRRVSKPTHGLYIMNGKKVIIK